LFRNLPKAQNYVDFSFVSPIKNQLCIHHKLHSSAVAREELYSISFEILSTAAWFDHLNQFTGQYIIDCFLKQ